MADDFVPSTCNLSIANSFLHTVNKNKCTLLAERDASLALACHFYAVVKMLMAMQSST